MSRPYNDEAFSQKEEGEMSFRTNIPVPLFPEKTEAQCLYAQLSDLRHDLFYLWVFLCAEDMLNSAISFLEDHEEDPVPFRTDATWAFSHVRG